MWSSPQSDESNKLIHTEHLSKCYEEGDNKTFALRDVSTTISGGEFVAIMGPSGSGKSTLLHMLGFLDKPTGGEYFFKGKSSKEYSDDELAKIRNREIGFIFQSFNLLARTSVFDNVGLPLAYSDIVAKEWKKRAEDAISSVGLSHRLGHAPSELSGGERQRVAIARALAVDPSVIFADEPTGNLDSVSGTGVMEILADLNKNKGHTIILITHEDEIADYARRRIILRDGMIESDIKTT